MHRRLLAAAGTVAALSAFAPAASATTLLETTATGSAAKLRTCHSGLLPAGPSVKRFAATAADTGLVSVRTDGGRGDWDIAVFGRDNRFVAAAAGPTSDEVASGFAIKGEPLTVQACLVRGAAAPVKLRVSSFEVPLSGQRDKVQLLAVKTPTQAERNRLIALGFDDSHSHGPDELDVVVDSAAEIEKLRANGFTWEVEIEDLVALERVRAKADREYAARTVRSGLPSGRTSYRHLADYEAELKALAAKHPGLVKLISLNHKSLEGRTIPGVEIAQNVNVSDGKPVFLQIGIHHAREWPAAEHPMEWAYELVNGYGKDARVTGLVNRTRTIVVPVMNPDGFNLSREAPVDPGNALAMVDLPPGVDSQLPVEDPTYIAALLADQSAGTFAYKRRNCRVKDGEAPKEGECGSRSNRTLGVDPNRNYGGFWGGPGASMEPDNDTYRGPGPFSEPETQNIRELVSSRQVTTLITNHTFSNLILRPPGLKSEGLAPDEPAMKALGDAMAANNGYASQYSWNLYDTSGTTEDWTYTATGGYGFTFEIGPDEFHPPFQEVVAEWEGAGQYEGKGNRAAYYLAQENTADARQHSVLRGTAPKDTVIRLHKEFMTRTSPVIKDASGETERFREFKDVLDSTFEVGEDGRFEIHANPSTRPFSRKARVYAGVADAPASEQDISSQVPVPPGAPRHVEFEVKPDAARQIRAAITGEGPDYDIYLYQGEVKPENQVGSSAGGTADEAIVYDFPAPGKYILEIVNYSAVSGYEGKISVFGEKPGTQEILPATTETYTLTCEKRDGTVFATRKLEFDRGDAKNLGRVCDNAPGGSDALRLGLRVAKAKRLALRRSLARGIRATATCSRRCTLVTSLHADKRTAKRLKLRQGVAGRSRAVTFTGRKAIRVKVARKVARKLRSKRSVKLTLRAVARDAEGNVKTRTVRLTLRR